MKNDCFYCENGEKLHSLMIPICELNTAMYILIVTKSTEEDAL